MKSLFPNLSTIRFILNEFETSDLGDIYTALSDPEVIRFYGVKFSSKEETREQLVWFDTIKTNKTGLWWAIRDGESLVGGIGFNDMIIGSQAEIGFWLMPSYWSMGIISEVAPMLIRFMVLAFDLKKVIAWVESENHRSEHTLNRLGFTKVLNSKTSELKWGKKIHSYCYELDENAFEHDLDFSSYRSERLFIRPTQTADAPFIFNLLNSPKWKRFIGDRGLKNEEDARDYIRFKMLPQLVELGYSNNTLVTENGEPIGVCGLYKRPGLDHADIGFALLPEWEGKGFGFESSSLLLHEAFESLDFEKVMGITSPENKASQKLLERLGLKKTGSTILPGEDEELLLYELSQTDYLALNKHS